MKYLLVFGLALGGCASMKSMTNNNGGNPEEKKQALIAEYNQVVGKSEDDIVLKYGAPTRTERAGNFIIYYYRTNHRVRSTAYVGGSIMSGNSSESFQETRFYFSKSRLVKWDVYTQ